MMSGMGRRLVWADRRTPRIVALNTWKAKEEQSRKTGSTTLSDRRTRKFAEDWQLQMQGHKAQSRIRATATQLMREPKSLLTQGSQESRVAADRQSPRQSTRTIDRPKREREADIDPHIPLPKLTREQKAEVTNTIPDSGIRTPNSTPSHTEATKRKAQSQHEGASSSKKRNNQASSSNDPSTEAHESSSTPKESESPKTKGRKRMAAYQLDDERSPHIRESEDAKNRWKQRGPSTMDQTEIANNSSMREDTETDMSRGSVRTISGVQTNSNNQGAILKGSGDEGDQIIVQSGGEHEKNSKPSREAEQKRHDAKREKVKARTEAAASVDKERRNRERCQVCNVAIKKAEHGTLCPPGPKGLGFMPGAPSCRSCVAHLQKRLQWYMEEQKAKYPGPTKGVSTPGADQRHQTAPSSSV